MLLQFIINGLITGLLYSLLAIGFALVYNTTHIFHIAAAGIYVFAAYMFWWLATTFDLPVFVAAVLSIILTMGLSLAVEIVVYRPLKHNNSSLNMAMIASIGLMIVIVNFIALFFGNDTKVIDNHIQNPIMLGELVLTAPQIWQASISVLFIVIFLITIIITKWGMQFRALSDNEALYSSLGYNPASTRTVIFLFSGLFIALASCLTVYDVGLAPTIGMNILISAIVAMIIGGSGRFSACIYGGLFLGILQSLTVFLFSSNWQNAVTFFVLLVFLFLRPQGIAGIKQRAV